MDNYKEKLRLAKEALNSGSYDKDTIEYIFPELKGSVDENNKRISKEISRFLKQNNGWNNEWLTWLKKQGEQKPFDYENANIQQKDFAPKAEPKFKVGDWVVFNATENIYQVGKIKNGKYHLKHPLGFQLSIPFSNEELIKKWTIKDAKDGDVLISQNNKPFIYNGTHDSIFVGSYCGISIDDKFKAAIEKCHWTENVNIYPATKEQRDTLMKEMTDAGYTFDFDKKMLKKVEE